jgi:curved DNA-binding protein CbpA
VELSDIERIFEWDSLIEETNYYELLGVLDIADEAAIRSAFHEFAVAFHPDAHPDADEETAGAIRRVFQRGTEAYRVLVRPELRAEYDLALAKGQLRLEPNVSQPPLSTGARSLDELCVSAAAKLHAKNADRFISQGDLALAKRELLLAISHEDEQSQELLERLDALDLALFAMGQ